MENPETGARTGASLPGKFLPFDDAVALCRALPHVYGEAGENVRRRNGARFRRYLAGGVTTRARDFYRGMGKRYWGCGFDNFQVHHPGQREVLAGLRQYAADVEQNVARGRGIVLFGPSGTGKDHLLAGVGRVALQSGLEVKATSGERMLEAFRAAIDSGRREAAVVGEFVAPDVLLLSDPAPPTEALSDWEVRKLFTVVDGRYSACRPTWVSMNVKSRDEADGRLSERVADRLRHGSLCLPCFWPSYRRPAEGPG